MTQAGVSSDEIAFLAGDERIEIEPKIKLSSLSLISETVEELRPAIPAVVPLWLAAYLRKREKCRIRTPHWLEVEQLQATLEEERRNDHKFAELPFHYLEVSKLLLEIAGPDIEEPNQIRVLLKDIEENRRAKLQRGLHSLNEDTSHAKLINVSAIELNGIRELSGRALDRMRQLAVDREGAAAGSFDSQNEASAGSSAGNTRLADALRRRSTVT